MKLYDMASAPNPRRVRIFLAEKGIEIDRVQIDISQGENLAPEFLAINPRGLLPTLQLDDGTVIDESIAICRYFEVLHPTPNLFGTSAVEQAAVAQWQRRVEFDGMMNIAAAYRNSTPLFARHSTAGALAPATTAIPALVERGRELVTLWLATLEAHMAGREWIAADRFTIADISAFVALEFAKWVKVRPTDDQPNLGAYLARLKARPASAA